MITVMAEHAGFCFGVKRAVDAIEQALQSNSEVWTIGLPIHNPQEVARLEALGLRVAQSESDIPTGAKVLIRAHGESLEVIDSLKAKGVDVEDMTCPFVKNRTWPQNSHAKAIMLCFWGIRTTQKSRA